MKKALKVIAGVALAGCMLLPLAACSDTDNSQEVKQLQQQIQDLQTEIDSLKNGNGGNDLFTGSPKFNYGINETIPYYVSGTKIFDFTVTSFNYQNTNSIDYTVNFISSFSTTETKELFTATLYDTVKGSLYSSNSNSSGSMYFDTGANNGNKKTIILYYLNSPFASITATPKYWTPSGS